MRRHQKKDPRLEMLRQWALVVGGSTLYAVGVGLFLDPARIASGGITGISVVLGNFFGLDTGALIIAMNLPVFVLGGLRFKGQFIIRTIFSVLYSSTLIDWFAVRFAGSLPLSGNMMLCALAGGAIIAVGMSMVFHGGATTGGVDILIKLIRQHKPHIRTGSLFMVFDLTAVLFSVLMFGDVDLGLYAIITLVTNAKVMDMVLYGDNEAKMIYIVSAHSEELSRRLLNDLGLGVTWLHGHGAYTQASCKVIFTVFRKQSYLKVRETVKEVDPDAFMIVTTATEIFGGGFRDQFSDEI